MVYNHFIKCYDFVWMIVHASVVVDGVMTFGLRNRRNLKIVLGLT